MWPCVDTPCTMLACTRVWSSSTTQVVAPCWRGVPPAASRRTTPWWGKGSTRSGPGAWEGRPSSPLQPLRPRGRRLTRSRHHQRKTQRRTPCTILCHMHTAPNTRHARRLDAYQSAHTRASAHYTTKIHRHAQHTSLWAAISHNRPTHSRHARFCWRRRSACNAGASSSSESGSEPSTMKLYLAKRSAAMATDKLRLGTAQAAGMRAARVVVTRGSHRRRA